MQRNLLIFAAVVISLTWALVEHAAGQVPSLELSKLKADERKLVADSRSAMISAGYSAAYFDRHFRVKQVVNLTADRRVIWEFAIGGFTAVIQDELGFYTTENGRRVDVHSVLNTIPRAHDIRHTISRRRAEALMTRCIGKHIAGPVVYQAFGTPRRARLTLTGSTLSKGEWRREKEKVKPKQNEAKDKSAIVGREELDKVMVEDVDNDRQRIRTAFIDLETGACVKGVAQADHP